MVPPASSRCTPSREARDGKALRTDANTNLMTPRAVMPTLLGTHAPTTEVWLVTAVFGLPSKGEALGAEVGWLAEWQKRPVVPKEILQLIDA
ncbi:hypothetical protein EW146_g4193 [Bondarzewia mesenterica]|uniref:DUF2264 domain-containing protein n=1 Tax=Bondarzewia mesenterica TaxID=1095465 RepID=A0A4S4LWB8_9AGAM|nr:hypothetical protein EW146_g4193 [Bondarzewia mesenterica]